ncbi:MAG: phosphopentomutase [Firmicutes bacterium]|nr:phosphopentomutase [Bacillota bacterium]
MANFRRAAVIVLDGAGAGEAPDAGRYGDVGSASLPHVIAESPGLKLPNLAGLGLYRVLGMDSEGSEVQGAYGLMVERSAGKDTTTGHWEIAGLILDRPFPTYPDGFPPEVIEPFEARIGRKVLGNYPASGTEIIKELGEEHMATGKPIVYTSADSVFQIAAHEEIIPVEELYNYCRIAREILVGPHAVGRVIARPFVGRPGSFERTARRRDFSLEPTGKTLLDLVKEAGLPVHGVGKIEDIFAGRGLTSAVHTKSNTEGLEETLKWLKDAKEGFLFVNLVDFDMKYGHRNDVQGFAEALKEVDSYVPKLLEVLTEDDLLIITADHGCDPTFPGTDHTRELVPLLVQNPGIREGLDLGTRQSFADVAATVADWLKVPAPENGTSFSGVIEEASR